MADELQSQKINILSLDGGGIRGYSSLQILEGVMLAIQKERGLAEVPRPCDYFDLIGGTSTGGLIAILLGRLKLSVAEALEAYDRVATQAFTPQRFPYPERYSSAELKKAIQDETKTITGDTESLYADEGACKTVVLAITSADVSAAPTKFTTYDIQPMWKDCTIWEIARATSAATTYFKPIKCGRQNIKFCDAGFGSNNPCEILIDEARNRAFRGREIGCILSIGTGIGGAIEVDGNLISIPRALKKMATSSKAVEDRMQRSSYITSSGLYGRSYWRFDENVGVGALKLDDYKKMSTIASLTHNYVHVPQTEASISDCVDAILKARRVIPNAVASVERIMNSPLHFVVPYNQNQDFVPQDRFDEYIAGQFSHRSPPEGMKQGLIKTTIHGTGGIGKTQLAIDYAYKARRSQSVFWIDAENSIVLESSVQHILRAIKAKPYLAATKHDYQIACRWLETAQDWLLIVDNVDDIKILQDVIPTTGFGDILLVTRDTSILSSDIVTDNGFAVSVMLPEQAIVLFLTRLLRAYSVGKSAIEVFVQSAKNIALASWPSGLCSSIVRPLSEDFGILKYSDLTHLVAELDCLPLALIQTAAYLSVPRFEIKLDKFMERLQGVAYPHHLGSVWTLSLNKLKQDNPAAGRLLLFFAFLDRRTISRAFLENSLSGRAFWDGHLTLNLPAHTRRELLEFLPDQQEGPDIEDSLRAISRLSLMEITRDGHIQIHHLMQEWIYINLSEQEAMHNFNLARILLDHQLPPIIYSKNSINMAKLRQEALLHLTRMLDITMSCLSHIENPSSFAQLFLNAYHWSFNPAFVLAAEALMKRLEKWKKHSLFPLVYGTIILRETSVYSEKGGSLEFVVRFEKLVHGFCENAPFNTPQPADKLWAIWAHLLVEFTDYQYDLSKTMPPDYYDKQVRSIFSRARETFKDFGCAILSKEPPNAGSLAALAQATILFDAKGARFPNILTSEILERRMVDAGIVHLSVQSPRLFLRTDAQYAPWPSTLVQMHYDKLLAGDGSTLITYLNILKRVSVCFRCHLLTWTKTNFAWLFFRFGQDADLCQFIKDIANHPDVVDRLPSVRLFSIFDNQTVPASFPVMEAVVTKCLQIARETSGVSSTQFENCLLCWCQFFLEGSHYMSKEAEFQATCLEYSQDQVMRSHLGKFPNALIFHQVSKCMEISTANVISLEYFVLYCRSCKSVLGTTYYLAIEAAKCLLTCYRALQARKDLGTLLEDAKQELQFYPFLFPASVLIKRFENEQSRQSLVSTSQLLYLDKHGIFGDDIVLYYDQDTKSGRIVWTRGGFLDEYYSCEVEGSSLRTVPLHVGYGCKRELAYGDSKYTIFQFLTETASDSFGSAYQKAGGRSIYSSD